METFWSAEKSQMDFFHAFQLPGVRSEYYLKIAGEDRSSFLLGDINFYSSTRQCTLMHAILYRRTLRWLQLISEAPTNFLIICKTHLRISLPALLLWPDSALKQQERSLTLKRANAPFYIVRPSLLGSCSSSLLTISRPLTPRRPDSHVLQQQNYSTLLIKVQQMYRQASPEDAHSLILIHSKILG